MLDYFRGEHDLLGSVSLAQFDCRKIAHSSPFACLLQGQHSEIALGSCWGCEVSTELFSHHHTPDRLFCPIVGKRHLQIFDKAKDSIFILSQPGQEIDSQWLFDSPLFRAVDPWWMHLFSLGEKLFKCPSDGLLLVRRQAGLIPGSGCFCTLRWHEEADLSSAAPRQLWDRASQHLPVL